MSVQHNYPWMISWEEWKNLQVQETDDLRKLAKKLAVRLGHSYGPKAAALYRKWANEQKKEDVVTWWHNRNA